MDSKSKTTLMAGLGLGGNVVGILVAVHRKSGFWGGVGWFIVGGMAGAALGYLITAVVPDNAEKKDNTDITIPAK